jgi:hypothetical protein
MATSEDIAAPATPMGGTGPPPKISSGARAMLMSTVTDWMIIPGLKLPVPRRAAVVATRANCRAMAGMNQARYSETSRAVSASADSAAA